MAGAATKPENTTGHNEMREAPARKYYQTALEEIV